MTQQGRRNRRDFLKTTTVATLGALAAGAPRQILAKSAGEMALLSVMTEAVKGMGMMNDDS